MKFAIFGNTYQAQKSHRMPKIFSACWLSIRHNSVSAASSIIS